MKSWLVAIFLIQFLPSPTIAGVGTCQYLSFNSTQQQAALSSSCVGVVDYPYFLKSGVSYSQLNFQATAKLNDPRFSILPQSCQAGFKKLVCGSIFLKCQPEVDLTNPATWNWNIYPTQPVPFQRPCDKLCTNIPPVCLGFTTLFGLTPNCTGTFNYGYGSTRQYDSSNDNSKCNAVPADITVGGTAEPYLKASGGGACSGIVTNLYIPPASLVSSLLAPMQPPFFIQSLIESKLQQGLSALPPVMSTACRFSLRKYLCSQAMYLPQAQVIRDVLLSNGISAAMLSYLAGAGSLPIPLQTYQFSLPSYPSRSICLDYSKSCASFIAFAKLAGQSQLVPNCTASQNGIQSFPIQNQTIISLPLAVAGSNFNVQFKTSPNKLVGAIDTSGYSPPSPGTCQDLTFAAPSDAYQSACAGAVDYSFFVPNGYSQQKLNSLAWIKLNNSQLSVAPATCQAALKKLVCSAVYLKCQPGSSLADPMTWNWGLYGSIGVQFPVPFQRPCGRLCSSIPSTCLGLTTLLGVNPDCTATYDYSGGAVRSVIQPTQFDLAVNSTQCNEMTAPVTVAGSSEPYLKSTGGGFCSGIVKNLYIPPSSLISSALAPMLPPYAIQTIIESTLNDKFKKLPSTMSPECRYSLRKYFCAQSMFYPQQLVVRDLLASSGISAGMVAALSAAQILPAALLSYSFALPQYPDHDAVCEEYAKTCKSFIQVAGLAALVPNCSAVSNGIKTFPRKNQTLLVLSATLQVPGARRAASAAPEAVLINSKVNAAAQASFEDGKPALAAAAEPTWQATKRELSATTQEHGLIKGQSYVDLNPVLAFIGEKDLQRLQPDLSPNRIETDALVTINLKLVTSPNKWIGVADTSGYKTVCPGGFVVPDEKSRNGVMTTWIPGTGCAIACLNPSHTPEDWIQNNKLMQVSSSLGFVLVSLLIVFLVMDKEGRKKHLVLTFAAISGFSSLWMAFVTTVPLEERMCSGNAARTSRADGATLCGAQGVIIGYTALTCCAAWVVQAIDLFFRVVWGWKCEGHWKYHIPIIFLAAVPSLVYNLAIGAYGFGGNTPWCLTSGHPSTPNDADIYFLYFPVLGITAVGVFAMTAVIWKIVVNVRKAWHLGSSVPVGDAAGAKAMAEMRKFMRNVKMLRTPLLFVVVFLVVWLSLFSMRGLQYTQSPGLKASFIEWAGCIFKNFDGTDDESWKRVCGDHPSKTLSRSFFAFAIFVGSGQSILVTIVYLPIVKIPFLKKWLSLPSTMQSSGAESGASSAESSSERVTHRSGRSILAGFDARIGVSNSANGVTSNESAANTTDGYDAIADLELNTIEHAEDSVVPFDSLVEAPPATGPASVASVSTTHAAVGRNLSDASSLFPAQRMVGTWATSDSTESMAERKSASSSNQLNDAMDDVHKFEENAK